MALIDELDALAHAGSGLAAIYALIDPRTSESRYVGYSKNYKRRFRAHIQSSLHNCNYWVHRWIREIISDGLMPTISVLEFVDIGWEDREKYWIETGRKNGWNLTNMTDGGDGVFNPSLETRQKMSMAKRGQTRTEEYKENMSRILTGRKFTPEHCKHLSESCKNKKMPPVSEETRKKISIAGIGRRHSEETKKKIGDGQRNRIFTEETRMKMSVARKNRPPASEETRRKMSEAHKRYYSVKETNDNS